MWYYFQRRRLVRTPVECKNRVVVCDWCGVEVFENSYKTHKDYRCPMRPRVEKIRPPTPLDPEPCELCGAFYLPDKISPEAHDCPVIRVSPCPNKCGESQTARAPRTSQTRMHS